MPLRSALFLAIVPFIACAPGGSGTSDAGDPPDAADTTPDAGDTTPDAGPVEPLPIPTLTAAPHTLFADWFVSCAQRDDGIYACWGMGGSGYAEVPRAAYVDADMSRHSYGCGLTAAGAIECWGDRKRWDDEGNTRPPTTGVFKRIELSGFAGCAIDDTDHLQCWGQQLATAPTGTVKDVTAGLWAFCAVMTDGTVTCWGDAAAITSERPFVTISRSEEGQNLCGLDDAGLVHCAQAMDGQPTDPLVRVNVGKSVVCGVKTDGTLVCWGGDAGITGAVPAGTFVDVAVGEDHACAKGTDRRITCWGNDDFWQTRPPYGTTTGHITMGNKFCVEKPDGRFDCMGNQASPFETDFPATSTLTQVQDGALHLCGLDSASKPVCVPAVATLGNFAFDPATTCASFSVGFSGACCLKSDGSTECRDSEPGPLEINPPLRGPHAEVCVGSRWACGRRTTDNVVTCWGNNTPSGANDKVYTKLHCGTRVLCGVKADGTIECDGQPESGNAGVNMPPAGPLTSFSIFDDACALRSDASITCWGRADYWRPFAPPAGRFKRVRTGNNFACAVDESDRLHCFGSYVRRPLD